MMWNTRPDESMSVNSILRASLGFGLRCCYVASAVGLGASAALNLIAWLPITISGTEAFFPLYLGPLILFLPAIFTYSLYPGTQNIKDPGPLISGFLPSRWAHRQLRALIDRNTPGWVKGVAACTGCYVLLYFVGALVFSASPGHAQDAPADLRMTASLMMAAYATLWALFASRLNILDHPDMVEPKGMD